MNKKTAYNSTFAIGGVSCPADSFVVAESFVLRINICAEKPAHRKSANRYCKAAWGTTRENIDSVCLALFTDRQALRNLTALKFITFASARITISLRHYS
jgi:hypothetical protein